MCGIVQVSQASEICAATTMVASDRGTSYEYHLSLGIDTLWIRTRIELVVRRVSIDIGTSGDPRYYFEV
jgi:hypothetical protein